MNRESKIKIKKSLKWYLSISGMLVYAEWCRYDSSREWPSASYLLKFIDELTMMNGIVITFTYSLIESLLGHSFNYSLTPKKILCINVMWLQMLDSLYFCIFIGLFWLTEVTINYYKKITNDTLEVVSI